MTNAEFYKDVLRNKFNSSHHNFAKCGDKFFWCKDANCELCDFYNEKVQYVALRRTSGCLQSMKNLN